MTSLMLVFREGNGDVAIAHTGVLIALEEDGAGLGFVAIERAAGDAGDLDVVVVLGSVAHYGEAAPHQRDVERLPFAGAERDIGRGRDEAVERAHFVRGIFSTLGADLDFIAAAQVDAAVAE